MLHRGTMDNFVVGARRPGVFLSAWYCMVDLSALHLQTDKGGYRNVYILHPRVVYVKTIYLVVLTSFLKRTRGE